MNFGGIPEEFSAANNSKVVILPVPYDGTSTWGKGADKGPEAILEASANMELFDIETRSEPYKVGIYTAGPITEKNSPEQMAAAVKEQVISYIENGSFVITIGGEHSVSIGAIQAHAAEYEDISVLQIDAHTDLREEYEGSAFNHACVMARAREIAPIVQVGIRSMSEDEVIRDPGSVFFAHEIRKNDNWKRNVIDTLKDKVYLTIDLDGFDPSIVPSTGTPEPGGLYWYETLELLKMLAEEKDLIGFDVVELCPDPSAKASDFLAAKLIYQLLAYKFILKR